MHRFCILFKRLSLLCSTFLHTKQDFDDNSEKFCSNNFFRMKKIPPNLPYFQDFLLHLLLFQNFFDVLKKMFQFWKNRTAKFPDFGKWERTIPQFPENISNKIAFRLISRENFPQKIQIVRENFLTWSSLAFWWDEVDSYGITSEWSRTKCPYRRPLSSVTKLGLKFVFIQSDFLMAYWQPSTLLKLYF